MKATFIVGTMRWGTWGANFSVDQASNYLKECLNEDIHAFDLADIYGNYTTEKLFGEAIKKSGVSRKDLRLVAKYGVTYPGSKYKIKGYNTTKKYIKESVINTLKYLNTDYIDILLIHRQDPLMNILELAETFTELKLEGKVKSFGVSNFSSYAFNLLNKEIPLETNQIEFSLTHPQALYDNSLLYAQAHDKRVQIWSPLGNFFLEKNEINDRINEVIFPMTEKYNASRSQILLAWVLKNPVKILPILGTTKIQRIKEQKKALDIELDQEDWYELLEASRGKAVE